MLQACNSLYINMTTGYLSFSKSWLHLVHISIILLAYTSLVLLKNTTLSIFVSLLIYFSIMMHGFTWINYKGHFISSHSWIKTTSNSVVIKYVNIVKSSIVYEGGLQRSWFPFCIIDWALWWKQWENGNFWFLSSYRTFE